MGRRRVAGEKFFLLKKVKEKSGVTNVNVYLGTRDDVTESRNSSNFFFKYLSGRSARSKNNFSDREAFIKIKIGGRVGWLNGERWED